MTIIPRGRHSLQLERWPREEGTGTIEISPSTVEVQTPEDFTISYTAATRIEDAYFVVQIPDDNAFKMPSAADDTQLVSLTLTDSVYPDPRQSTNRSDDETPDLDETRSSSK